MVTLRWVGLMYLLLETRESSGTAETSPLRTTFPVSKDTAPSTRTNGTTTDMSSGRSSADLSARETAAIEAAPFFTLNKCCRENEHLDKTKTKCEPLQSTVPYVGPGMKTSKETDFWWMNMNVRVGGSKNVRNLLDLIQSPSVQYHIRPCDLELTAISWTSEVYFHLNGSLELELLQSAAPGKNASLLLPPADYCIDYVLYGTERHLVFLACPCDHVVCVRKCCDYDRMMTIESAVAMDQKILCNRRRPQNITWNVPLTTEVGERVRRPANVPYARLRPFSGNCKSEDRKTVTLDLSVNAQLLSNGTLIADVKGSPISMLQFCVDYGEYRGKEGYYSIACAKVPLRKPMGWSNVVYVVLYMVGFLALVTMLVVYALLPELRRPVNAKALMCHAAALAAALLTLAVSHCISIKEYTSCAAIAFFAQFFLLAAFFWLSVLCFDITRGLRHVLPINDAKSANRRLAYYSLFAWGGSAFIVAISVAFTYAPNLPTWLQRPDIGKYGCWFGPTWGTFWYYYGPVACLLLANLAMFSYTMVRLRATQREMALLQKEDSHLTGGALRRRRERLLLYVKLFSLMGGTWLLEVVVWAVGADRITEVIVDAVNVLRGVGVFMACCCKRDVIDALRDRLGGVLPFCDTRRPDDMASRTTSTAVSTHASSPDCKSLKKIESKHVK